MSSAYNGLLENPLFTGVLGYEVQQQAKGRATLAANLLGGAIGYIIFGLLGGKGLAGYLDLPPVTSFKFLDVLYVMLLAIVGVVLAVILAPADARRDRDLRPSERPHHHPRAGRRHRLQRRRLLRADRHVLRREPDPHG